MPWLRTSQFAITNRDILTFGFNPVVAMGFAGIWLRDVPAAGYARYGYLWARAPLSIDGVAYATEIDLGPIWRREYRWQIFPQSQVSALLFKPSQNLPLPCDARFLYFTP